mmetsp:Transcript_16892/g.31406  ORF Transcript_16892/g.31406 Transcript_16892/m.31406 type:complete len:428 (+) Transcript_16892:91-1374(+)
MSSMMQQFAFVLICVACSGYGRRVQPSVEQMKSLQSDDAGLISKEERVTTMDRNSHEVLQKQAVSSPSPLSSESRSLGEPLMQSWSAARCGYSASIVILIVCLGSYFLKRFVESSKSNLSQHIAGEYSVYFRAHSTSDVKGAAILSPDKKSAKDDFVSSDTDDTGGISDPPDISDTNSSVTAEESASHATDDTGNISELSDASDASSSVTVEELTPLEELAPLPLTLEYCSINPSLLTEDMAHSLLEYLPAGLRIPGASSWRLCYKPSAHGTSMATLHRKLAGCESSLLLIRDADDHLFGGFAPTPWKIGGRFHGTGEAFVFTFGNVGSGTPADENEEQASSDSPEVKVFPWTSSNHYFMYAESGLLAMGGGDGCHALAVHEGLLCGHSSPTPTFGNPALSAAPEGDFVVKDMELWSLDYTTSTLTW